MSRATPIVRGAIAGTLVGLCACITGAGYIAENASAYGGIAWSTVGAVFITQLALTGALFGGLFAGAKSTLDRWVGRRTSWAPALAGAVAMAIGAAPSGAFGAGYFGALRAPFMGAGTIFSIAAILGVGLAASGAWLDQKERGTSAGNVSHRARRALLTSIALAVPVVAIGGLLAAFTPDEDVLRWFRNTDPWLLGGALGAALGAAFGLYAGAVVGAVRRLDAPAALPARLRVAAPTEAVAATLVASDDEVAAIDPLAEEDAELEARFAELDRRERVVRH